VRATSRVWSLRAKRLIWVPEQHTAVWKGWLGRRVGQSLSGCSIRANALLALVFLVGCPSVGPKNIVRDRFDYATAISESWKLQLLGNMVRIRYSEPPVFLDIESAITSYSIDASANAGASIYPSDAASSYLSLGVSGSYGERPTITYNPLVGERFSKSLMTPIPPEALLALLQTGWNAELLLRACVHSINGLQNRSLRVLSAHDPDPRFNRLLELLGRIQREGGLGMRVLKEKETSETRIFFSPPATRSGPVADDIVEVEKLLGIDLAAREFKATYGLVARDNREIAILTRSVLEILLDLSSYVQVPAEHLAEHRAAPGFEALQGRSPGLTALISIRSGLAKPPDAFAAVRYRDYWFWIDD
jgi:hypothetical protein